MNRSISAGNCLSVPSALSAVLFPFTKPRNKFEPHDGLFSSGHFQRPSPAQASSLTIITRSVNSTGWGARHTSLTRQADRSRPEYREGLPRWDCAGGVRRTLQRRRRQMPGTGLFFARTSRDDVCKRIAHLSNSRKMDLFPFITMDVPSLERVRSIFRQSRGGCRAERCRRKKDQTLASETPPGVQTLRFGTTKCVARPRCTAKCLVRPPDFSDAAVA
jgi:hypothetical protein